jgi:hypothetical protein
MPRVNMMEKRGYHIVRMDFYNIHEYMHTAVAITWMKSNVTNDNHIHVQFNYQKGGFKVDQANVMKEQ